MLAVVLATLAKIIVILEIGLRNISKRIKSVIFVNIYTPPQHALTYIMLWLSLQLPSTHVPLYFCFFAALFHLLFSLSLTLINSIFYYLHYISLLLHLITTHLVSKLSLSSIIFIISDTNCLYLYCLNYTLLLLHPMITHLANTY